MDPLEKLATSIQNQEDKALFLEAVKAVSVDAFRGAYILIWLSCAESLKRRFKEAQLRDATAGKVVGEVEQRESSQHAVDKYLLDEAKNYGFISDSAHTILFNIYQMRCVYGHPYEMAPQLIQVVHAAEMVVTHVLSQPVRLRHGFGKELVKSLTTNKNFLDDRCEAVTTFVTEISPKIDGQISGWLLKQLWTEAEKIADDSSMKLFFSRAVWFSQAYLRIVGPLFQPGEWHDLVGKYPKALAHIISDKPLFSMIGEFAQNSLVGAAFDLSTDRVDVLRGVPHE